MVEIAVYGCDAKPCGGEFVPIGGCGCQVVAGGGSQTRDLPVGEQMIVVPMDVEARICALPSATNLDWMAAVRVGEDGLHLRSGCGLQSGKEVRVGDADGEQPA